MLILLAGFSSSRLGKECKHPLLSLRSVGYAFRYCVTHKNSLIIDDFNSSDYQFSAFRFPLSAFRLSTTLALRVPSANEMAIVSPTATLSTLCNALPSLRAMA